MKKIWASPLIFLQDFKVPQAQPVVPSSPGSFSGRPCRLAGSHAHADTREGAAPGMVPLKMDEAGESSTFVVFQ